MKIAVLGGGNMGGAIASGIVASGIADASSVVVSHAREAYVNKIKSMGYEPYITDDNVEAVSESSLIFIAVKPWKAADVIREIIPHIDTENVVIASVVAGMTFDDMGNIFKEMGRSVPAMYRVIPNTAIALGESTTFISSYNTTAIQDDHMRDIFMALGKVFVVPETDMTAVTALSSCGIAYILKYIDAATRGGEDMGIDRCKAQQMVMQTVRGALALLEANASTPQEEIDKVTTPGGITLKGLEEMERCGFTQSVINGLKASR
ncbi:MAG: pyrroline-5-carboxylate reductase [Flavobacteriales bacterium]|jgi:pyrroline-5-carboxylate reductase|nr:pyrroline-5-carboxylate reductase [Flavobacteriales bacterium]